MRARIAPTEYDTDFRKRLLRGEVHDENAWAMGGVPGNAGLFSTAGDVAAFAQMLLNGGIYAHHRLLARATIQQFTARQVDRRFRANAGLGRADAAEFRRRPLFFAEQLRAHGFTGTSLWIDPERDLFVVLLTNRVNPTRANEQIRAGAPGTARCNLQALGLANASTAAR